MGFDINEKVTVELDYKDVALITVALGRYQEEVKEHSKIGDANSKELLERARNITNRLGNKLYDVPEKG